MLNVFFLKGSQGFFFLSRFTNSCWSLRSPFIFQKQKSKKLFAQFVHRWRSSVISLFDRSAHWALDLK